MKKKIIYFMLLFFAFSAASAHPYSNFINDSLNIYPNPAKEYLKLEFHSNVLAVPDIRIIDLTGKVVLKFDREFVLNQECYIAELDISDLNTGIYFVKVIQNKKVYSQKLVVR